MVDFSASFISAYWLYLFTAGAGLIIIIFIFQIFCKKKTSTEHKRPPISFCSSDLVTTSGPGVPESALAGVTPGNKVWKGKSELSVWFMQDIPVAWKIDNHPVNRRKILELANIWNDQYNGIPKFVEAESLEDSDIRVRFWDGVDANGNKIFRGNFTELGTDANKKPTEATMWLDLSNGDNVYNKHVVTHEFGHALGLGHEHQRPEFWKIAGEFLSMTKMYDDHRLQNPSLTRVAFEQQWGINRKRGKGREYDPNSMMHYWFKKEWLKDEYSHYQDLQVVEDDKSLSDKEKQVLRRIHNQNLALVPSVEDIEFLETVYKDKKQTLCTILAPPAPDGNGPTQNGTSVHEGATPNGLPKDIGATPEAEERVVKIEVNDASKITRYLRTLTNIQLRAFGVASGLDPHEVDKYPDQGLCMTIVLAWLRREYHVNKVLEEYPYGDDLTWNVLAAILEEEGQGQIAKTIREKKCT